MCIRDRPIPGAMGVADYIMIDGFKQLVGRNAANMEDVYKRQALGLASI